MTQIEKEAIIAGKNKSGRKKIIIDTGADISYISKEQAEEFGLKFTGETTDLELADGSKIKAEIAEGSIDIPRTCCKGNAKFAVVSKDKSGTGILVGNDYMENVGMKIDMTKKDEHNISCDCGGIIENAKKIRPEDLVKILNKIDE